MLSRRERELVILVAEGYSAKQIARRWSVSVRTVETHWRNALGKLWLQKATDLVRYAFRTGMVPLEGEVMSRG